MGIEKKELRMFLNLGNGERVELMPFGEFAEIVIEGSEKDKPDAMEERYTEMANEAHRRCLEKTREAQEYCQGYIDGLNGMFNVCRDIMDGEAEGQ